MKALASDFDGTLYVNGKIDSKDVEAINQFQKDNLFGICTGRPIKHTVYFLTDHFKSDFYITSTGSYILDKELNADILDKKIKEIVISKEKVTKMGEKDGKNERKIIN